jgi:hypothetical protein
MKAALESIRAEMTMALAGLDATQTQATPAQHPEKWSIQQIAEHLLQTYRATAPVLRERIEKCTPTRATPSLQQKIGQFLIINLGRFPNGRRAPDIVTPGRLTTLKTGAELSNEFEALLSELDALVTQGEILFGTRRAASHIILGPLSMVQWCGFHRTHARHHIKQIRAIRRDHAF